MGNTNLTKEIYLKNGKYEVFSASGSDGLSNDFEHTGEAVILSAIGARCGKCFYAQGKWTAIKNTIIIRPLKNQEIILKYLFYILNNEAFWNKKGGAQPFITLASARNQYLPLPSLEEQKKIVDELDSYHQIVESITSSIRYWKPYFKIDDGWDIINLGDITTLIRGITFEKNDCTDFYQENYIGVVTTKSAQRQGIEKQHLRYVPASFVEDDKYLKNDDILISLANSLNLVGRTTFVEDLSNPLSFGAFIGVIRANVKYILPKYLFFVLNNNNSIDFFRENARTTTNISNLNFSNLKKLPISLPPLHIQQEIVKT